jgi:ribosomal protein S18 acetylase RimI-like enzyme
MSRGLRVRRWVPADLDRIGLVHSRSRQDAYASLVPAEALARVTPEQQVRAWTARLFSLPEQHAAIVVEHEGEVVGFALAQLDAESGAELNAIHVLPEHHGTGAGQSLMDEVFKAFGEWGVAEAHLHVIEGNERAQAFYRRNGWRLHGPAGAHEVGGATVPILEYRLVVPIGNRELPSPARQARCAAQGPRRGQEQRV